MSARRVLVWLILVAVTGVLPAAAQEAVPVIVTRGEAVTRHAPDRAWLVVATETRDRNAATARERAAEAMTNVQAAIEQTGIPADAIRTIGFSLTPEMHYDEGRGEIRGYVVRNRVEVQIDDLDRLAAVIDAADSRRDTGLSIIGPRFGLQNDEDAQGATLQRAVEVARARAAAMAAGAGGTLGAIVRIEDQPQGGPVPRPEVMMMRTVQAADQPETPITPGEIEVRAMVTLTVELR